MGVVVPEWGSREKERVPHDRCSHDIGCDEMWRKWGLCTGQSWRSSELCKGEGMGLQRNNRGDKMCKIANI